MAYLYLVRRQAMRFHDFHLSGYSVRKFGGEILLHLIYDYPPRPPEESHIRFGDVEFYHFVHTRRRDHSRYR